MVVPTSEYRAPAPAEPPSTTTDPVMWVRLNLFPNWWNTLLTLVLAPLMAWGAYRSLRMLFVTGRWDIIEVNLTSFMVGTFPRGELWRLWVAMGLMSLVVGLGLGMTIASARRLAAAAGRDHARPWHEPLRRLGPPAVLVAVLIAFVRTPTPIVLLAVIVVLGLVGFRVGLRLPPGASRWVNLAVVAGIAAAFVVVIGFDGVPQGAWGGLLLTAYFTIAGILLSFPIGVAVALGRRSTLPVVRGVCITYVEFFRGSPLVTLLFMGWLVLGFFLPPGAPTIDLINRVLIIFVLFTSAYVAEIVRGGLQGVPKGQFEAAQSLGLSPWKQTRLIILPQALRSVIPALVGQFISLYKDTALVFVVGLLDLLRVARRVTQQEAFLGQGLQTETLLFVSLIYWVGSYWMSRESQRLETRLGVGVR